MKKTRLFVAVLLLVSLVSTLNAQNFKISPDHPKYDQVVLNLLEAMNSGNEGLKFSAAYALGEMKAEAAIDNLCYMLRNHEDENYRIMAALSLTKIGTERCLFIVKRVGKFTDQTKLAKFCDKFYNARTFPLPENDKQVVAALFK